jgi:hypothetical protein
MLHWVFSSFFDHHHRHHRRNNKTAVILSLHQTLIFKRHVRQWRKKENFKIPDVYRRRNNSLDVYVPSSDSNKLLISGIVVCSCSPKRPFTTTQFVLSICFRSQSNVWRAFISFLMTSLCDILLISSSLCVMCMAYLISRSASSPEQLHIIMPNNGWVYEKKDEWCVVYLN